MNNTLKIWKHTFFRCTVFNATNSTDSVNVISGGYYDVLLRAEEKYGVIDYIKIDGVIKPWSKDLNKGIKMSLLDEIVLAEIEIYKQHDC